MIAVEVAGTSGTFSGVGAAGRGRNRADPRSGRAYVNTRPAVDGRAGARLRGTFLLSREG